MEDSRRPALSFQGQHACERLSRHAVTTKRLLIRRGRIETPVWREPQSTVDPFSSFFQSRLTLGSGTRGGCGASCPEIRRFWRRRAGSRVVVDAGRINVPGYRPPRLTRLEAALFVADRPLSARRLAHFAAIAEVADVRAAVSELNDCYQAAGTPFRVQRAATGYQLLTLPDFVSWLDKVHERHARLRLSPPAMETLAIVAYRQPILRADVEAIRGVMSGEMLKQLMERGLVRIAGEDESLGRPYLYGTTRQFLEMFGLHSLSDLPGVETRRPQPTADDACENAAAELEEDQSLDDVAEDDEDDWDEEDFDADELLDERDKDAAAA